MVKDIKIYGERLISFETEKEVVEKSYEVLLE
jgi:hypothetical protein